MNQEKQSEALRLSEIIERYNSGCHSQSMVEDYCAAADELRRQHFALNEWFEKTEWVQETSRPKELGMHRADVLRNRIADLEAQLSAIGAGGVEALRKRDGLQKSENAATDRDTHFYLAGWNGARGNDDSHKHFRKALQAAQAPKD